MSSQGLESLLSLCQERVNEHPLHDLNLGLRQAIWVQLGPHKYDVNAQDGIGYIRRTQLAILAIRYVLSIWNEAFPDDQTPNQILIRAEQVIQSSTNAKDIAAEIGNYWDYMDGIALNTQNMVVAVGYGAVKALSTAMSDEFFDEDDIDYSLTDNEEFEMNDASFFAAIAYAGGPVWTAETDPTNSSKKRMEFWSWWLQEAVPAVWKIQV